jgi:hypothetical protein
MVHRQLGLLRSGRRPVFDVKIGPIGFGVRAEAESRMRTVGERESGATTGGGGVRIEERERLFASGSDELFANRLLRMAHALG